MVCVGSSPIRRCRSAVQTHPSIDCCSHDPVGLNVGAQGEGVLAGPFEAYGLIETLSGLICS